MALSTDDAARLATLRAQLADALNPDRITKVTSAGRSMEKANPNLERLQGQIDALEAAANSRSGRVRKRGSITFRFR